MEAVRGPLRAAGRVALAVQANGAAMLAGSLVPTTLAGHPYWQVEDPAARRQQRIHFFKNVGQFGGALLVLSERPRPRRPGRG